MITRSLSIATTIALLSTSALAAPVFMLQFGSFETKQEAETRLGEITSKHTGALGVLSPNIREVTLPPDNLTVYRTQAGPLATRAEAQSLCSQLAAKGDQCYVVETAMMPGASVPVVAQTQPAVPLAPAGEPAVKVAAPMVVSSKVEATARDSESKAMIAGVSGGDSGPGFNPMPKIETSSSMPAPLPVTDSRPMDMALDEAAARQSGAPAAPVEVPTPVATAPAPKKERSFWSRMNPFSDDEEKVVAAVPPAVPVSDTALAAPVDRVTADTAQMPPTPFVVDPTVPPPARPIVEATPPVEMAAVPVVPSVPPAPEPMAPLPSPALVTSAPEPVAPAMPLPSPALLASAPDMPVSAPPAASVTAPAMMMTAAPVTPPAAPAPTPVAPPLRVVEVPPVPVPAMTSGMQLPPPPAPLRAQDREALAAGQMPASAPPILRPQPVGELPGMTSVAPPAMPVAVAPLAPAPAAPFRSGPSTLPGGGETPAPMPVAPVQAAPTPMMGMAVPVPAMPAMQPSATIGQKTLWAQISQFGDEQEALAFWDAYTSAHPDFPQVRVRVISPYQRAAAVSLRVGPFSRVESVRNLCSTMPVKKLRCGSVTDMGVSVDPRGTQPAHDSRYQR